RLQLQREILGDDCPVLYHTGPAGDQSPRHVTRANTFAEAERLGSTLADAVKKVASPISLRRDVAIDCRSAMVSLPFRQFPSETDAQTKLDRSIALLENLRSTNAPKAQTRTAEVDWFGAQETLTLARAAAQGKVAQAAATCMPAEVQVIQIGPWN